MDFDLSDLPLRPIFYVSSIVGIILVLFLVRIADITDEKIGIMSKRPWLGWARRISMLGQIFAMALCVIYGYRQNWDPWPPFVVWIIACDIQHFVRILTRYRDRVDFVSWPFDSRNKSII